MENERTKRKRKEKEKEEREKQITVTAGPFWGIISNYSYRRASAGELILHYITVGPSPGIRNVIIIAAMVLFSKERFPEGACSKVYTPNVKLWRRGGGITRRPSGPVPFFSARPGPTREQLQA